MINELQQLWLHIFIGKSYPSSSYVSTGRSSHVSIITLSGKLIEGAEPNGNGVAICPLQGYLFGTAIELSETTTAAKKEHMTSLGELFQRSKSTEENFSAKCEKEEKRTKKELDKSAMNLMKEKLKKRMLHAYSKYFIYLWSFLDSPYVPKESSPRKFYSCTKIC